MRTTSRGILRASAGKRSRLCSQPSLCSVRLALYAGLRKLLRDSFTLSRDSTYGRLRKALLRFFQHFDPSDTPCLLQVTFACSQTSSTAAPPPQPLSPPGTRLSRPSRCPPPRCRSSCSQTGAPPVTTRQRVACVIECRNSGIAETCFTKSDDAAQHAFGSPVLPLPQAHREPRHGRCRARFASCSVRAASGALPAAAAGRRRGAAAGERCADQPPGLPFTSPQIIGHPSKKSRMVGPHSRSRGTWRASPIPSQGLSFRGGGQ